MEVPNSKIFLLCLLGFVFGVGFASFINIEFLYVYIIILLHIIALIFFWQSRKNRTITLVGLFFVLGIGRMIISQPDINNTNHIASYNGENVVVQGVVILEPDVRLDHQKLTIKLKSVSDKVVQGRLLIKTELYPQYKYGDLLYINCNIQAPEPIEDFSYDKYLARYDIYSVCWRGDIESLESGKGNFAMSKILSVKTKFMNTINGIISEPHAAFLSGLLIGARRGIPEYLIEAFNRTGTTHIIAISGSNITIIAAVIIGFMQFLGIDRKRAFWWISIGIIVFVILTGATASVVRAGVMGIFVLLARQLGRTSRATNALVFTAFVMILVNPKILIFDAGFQLSFLATVGLVYINPVLQKYTRKLPKLIGIKEAFVTTISAIITTTPLLIYQFGRLSLVAPLANILILPAIPTTMAIGFVAGIVGIVWQNAGHIIVWPAWLLLEYMVRVAEVLSSWKFASIEFGEFSWVLMIGLYGLIGWWIIRINKLVRTI